MVIYIFDNLLNKNQHEIPGEVREKFTKKSSSKIFKEQGASSSLVSENKKLSVTLNILIHKVLLLKKFTKLKK